MTELSTEPVAVEAAPTAPPPPAPAPTEQAPAAAEVDHTPGGWPVVPLALSGANSTVSMVAAASLAGGPIAAMVAATGAIVLGTVAATRSRRPNPRRESRRGAARAAGRSAARATGTRQTGTAGSRAGGRGSAAGAGRAGGRSGRVPGQHRRGSGAASRATGTANSGAGSRKSTGRTTPQRAAGVARKAAGRLGQVRAVRASQQAAAGSRAGQRAQTTAARRAVADARRNARTHAAGATSRNANTPRTPGRRGGGAVGRMLSAASRRTGAARDAAVARGRTVRDQRARSAVDTHRQAVRRAPARRAARQALRRSAARFHGRRLLAALLALPLGLLGLVTTPIGRKFDIPWLMYPGRRLYWRIVRTATEQRANRDAATRERQAEQEAAAEAEATQDGAEGIADGVERPAAQVPTSTNTESIEGEHVSGFRFEEAASEMEQAATQYDPENAMEILAMVEGLPAALTSVANVMKILAERSDSEFPLEKEVADGFNDIFGALMSAVAVAEDMGPLFRQAHEQDIARHEDPRNGTEAEKGWNV
ncbi:hypothetical protein NC239_16965 [Streptomyces sp. G3]|uniref:hypothetical protein n=1 Tax=Streptomyces sp. G3 TaxID=690144 RepID=UPI0020309B25|nr:hypothetical protein [Streptomyces sp. G3]MCM1939909.1 hypothetical protein [Streptomyces sp. G3]